jgi:hypothetical protein
MHQAHGAELPAWLSVLPVSWGAGVLLQEAGFPVGTVSTDTHTHTHTHTISSRENCLPSTVLTRAPRTALHVEH